MHNTKIISRLHVDSVFYHNCRIGVKRWGLCQELVLTNRAGAFWMAGCNAKLRCLGSLFSRAGKLSHALYDEIETSFSFYLLYQWRIKILKANPADKIEIDDSSQSRIHGLTQILYTIELCYNVQLRIAVRNSKNKW